jgi:hypothetical protein
MLVMKMVKHASFMYKGEQIQIVPNLHLQAVMILFSYALLFWFADDCYSCKSHLSVRKLKQIQFYHCLDPFHCNFNACVLAAL